MFGPDSPLLSYTQLQDIIKRHEEPEKALVSHIRRHSIKFFNTIHTEEHCVKAFERMASTNYKDILIKKFWAKGVYPQETRRGVVLKKSKYDFAISNFFFEEYRMKTSLSGLPSPQTAFYSDKHLSKAMKYLIKKLPVNQPVTCRGIRNAIFAYFSPMEQFNPLAARFLIDQYGEGGNILDINSGWGDRLAGFMASNAEAYTGICDSPDLLNCYIDQIDFLTDLKNDDQDVSISFEKSEILEYDSGVYDLILTSIPRYNLHKGDAASQNHRSLSAWKKDYLKPSIESAWEGLKTNGYMCIHLDDYKKNGNRVNIVNYLTGSIGTELKATRLPPIGYQISRNEKNLIEPIWIFKKTNKLSKNSMWNL